MTASKKRTVLLGMILLAFLGLAYFENMAFFEYSGSLFTQPLVGVLVVFVHNVLVVSLILLAMTFYVELVLSFFKPRKYEYIVLQHPRVFALVFTCMIILLSILRASTIVFGSVALNGLAVVLLLSLPNGIIEGYGIYLTIQKTLKRNMMMKDLLTIYLLFFIAAIVEVGFVQLLFLASST
ncbi:MAG: hypothetical protein WCC63_05570 [Candidatus Bathyarchaeia archaeon]